MMVSLWLGPSAGANEGEKWSPTKYRIRRKEREEKEQTGTRERGKRKELLSFFLSFFLPFPSRMLVRSQSAQPTTFCLPFNMCSGGR